MINLKKKILFLISLAVISSFFLLNSNKNSKNIIDQNINEVRSIDKPSSPNSLKVDLNNSSYFVYWHKIKDINKLTLVSNFPEMSTSDEFFDENNCFSLFSGGFYDQDKKHIGLLISDGQIISQFEPNLLFNGVISIDLSNQASINNVLSESKVRYALQSGPIIILDNNFATLKLKTDKEARRMLFGIDKSENIYFLVIYNPDSVFYGPRLADLPEIIKIFEENSGIDFVDMLNLDGGSASLYYTTDLKLKELSPVGSYFCEFNY